jgi:hypothetical protein
MPGVVAAAYCHTVSGDHMPYTDTYIAHSDQSVLQNFLKSFVNYIPCRTGRAATEAATDENGNFVPAQSSVGDPALYYSCIRTTFDPTPLITAPFTIVPPEIGAAIVGVFA